MFTQTKVLTEELNELALGQCGRRKDRPKKHFISDQTWTLRSEKLRAKRLFHQTGKAIKREWLCLAWKAFLAEWHEGKGRRRQAAIIVSEFEDNHAYRAQLACSRVRLAANLAVCTKELRTQLRRDRAHALSACLDSMPPDIPAGALLTPLKPFTGPTNLKKKKQKALPILKDSAGQLVKDPDQLLDTWVEFFAAMEGGHRISDQQFFNEWVRDLERFECHESVTLTAAEVPSD